MSDKVPPQIKLFPFRDDIVLQAGFLYLGTKKINLIWFQESYLREELQRPGRSYGQWRHKVARFLVTRFCVPNHLAGQVGHRVEPYFHCRQTKRTCRATETEHNLLWMFKGPFGFGPYEPGPTAAHHEHPSKQNMLPCCGTQGRENQKDADATGFWSISWMRKMETQITSTITASKYTGTLPDMEQKKLNLNRRIFMFKDNLTKQRKQFNAHLGKHLSYLNSVMYPWKDAWNLSR